MDKPPHLQLRQIDWRDFNRGGYESNGKKSWQPPKVIDQRDNQEEAEISNLYAAKFRAAKANRELEASLTPERTAEILRAMEAAAMADVATSKKSWMDYENRKRSR